MSISEIKNHLHKQIDTINDEELLKEIHEIINRTQGNENHPEWNALPKELKLAIEEGLMQSENGQVISHEEFLIRFGKWNTK